MSNSEGLASKKNISSVAVIITCYNLGGYIIEAIKSVKEQSIKPQQIIVIDDGSNEDETIKIINSLSSDVDIKLIMQKNQGVSKARNNAAKQVNCDYILFLDADDTLHQDFIKFTKDVLDNDINKNLGFVTTWVNTFGLSNGLWKTQGSDYKDEIISNEFCGTSLMRKEMFDNIGGYSTDMSLGYEDWDFWISAIEKGYGWEVVKKSLFNYRIRSNSRNKSAIEKDKMIKELIVKRHPKLYLEKVLDQYELIKKQKDEIKKQKYEIVEQRNEILSLKNKIEIINNDNERKIVKQAIAVRNNIDKLMKN